METLDVAAPTVAPDSADQHADAHSHAGGHTNAHDYAKANESHFDHEAQLQGNFVQSKWIELSKKLGTTMVARYPALFQKVSTSVLDFACGPGTFQRSAYSMAKLSCPYLRLGLWRVISPRQVYIRSGYQPGDGLFSSGIHSVVEFIELFLG